MPSLTFYNLIHIVSVFLSGTLYVIAVITALERSVHTAVILFPIYVKASARVSAAPALSVEVDPKESVALGHCGPSTPTDQSAEKVNRG